MNTQTEADAGDEAALEHCLGEIFGLPAKHNLRAHPESYLVAKKAIREYARAQNQALTERLAAADRHLNPPVNNPEMGTAECGNIAILLDDLNGKVLPLAGKVLALLAKGIAEAGCGCRACRPPGNLLDPKNGPRFIVCGLCGNKRCPHATDHRHACTNSNEPGQPGSVFA